MTSALQWADELQRAHVLSPETRVSAVSSFGNDTWDFNDKRRVRLTSVPRSRLVLDWSLYADGAKEPSDDHRGAYLPRPMVEELKLLAFLALKVPGVISTKSRNPKPSTVVVLMRGLIRLFSEIYKASLLPGLPTSSHFSHLQSVSEITIRQLKKTLFDYPSADGNNLKRSLRWLAMPAFARYLPAGPVQWTASDLDTIDFRVPKARRDFNRVMPNDLFRQLSKMASSDVATFLAALSIERTDLVSEPHAGHPLFVLGRSAFEDYVRIRGKDRDSYEAKGKKGLVSVTGRRRFRKTYGFSPSQFFELMCRTQRAAFTVVALYTGARYSDLTTFESGCIEKKHGAFVLRGTEVKMQPIAAPEGEDLWPAIPAIRDAVRCLEEISRFTFNQYLISATETVAAHATATPLSLAGYTGALNRYLRDIDASGRWANWHINPHQLRHTLAHQLARSDVGLVFIAHQMKHLHTALSALPPQVTLMYGNIGALALERATQSGAAYQEAAHLLFDPEAPVAGGGAEEFRQRRKAYFEGMVAQGYTVDQVINHVAAQGMPFASVGIGFCRGKRDFLLKDGTKEKPPCIGSLQCNPKRCQQALITQAHIPQWRKIHAQNVALSKDARMAHAGDVFAAAAAEAATVLAELGAPIRE